MFAFIIGKLISAPIIGAFLRPIIDGLVTAQKQKLDAIGSHEAQVEALGARALDLDRREAEVNASVVIAEQGNWFTRTPRPAMGWAATILVWKILVWDLALGEWTHGSTDKLSSQAFWILTTIIIAYFGGRTIDKGISSIAGIFKKV